MCGGVIEKASLAWWQVTHRRPLLPKSWKKGLMVVSVGPPRLILAKRPSGSENSRNGGTIRSESEAEAIAKPVAASTMSATITTKGAALGKGRLTLVIDDIIGSRKLEFARFVFFCMFLDTFQECMGRL
jgi:hypothetical protein